MICSPLLPNRGDLPLSQTTYGDALIRRRGVPLQTSGLRDYTEASVGIESSDFGPGSRRLFGE